MSLSWEPDVCSEVEAGSRLRVVTSEYKKRARGDPTNEGSHVHRVASAGNNGVDDPLVQNPLLISVPNQLDGQRHQRLPQPRRERDSLSQDGDSRHGTSVLGDVELFHVTRYEEDYSLTNVCRAVGDALQVVRYP